jgi:hypothetical protein
MLRKLGKYLNLYKQQTMASTKSGFEVFYHHDDVNTWLDCEIIDIIQGSGHHSG